MNQYELVGEKMECIGQKDKVISIVGSRNYRRQCYEECKRQQASMFSFSRDTTTCSEKGSCDCICELQSKHGKCSSRYNNDYNLYALTNYGSK